MLMNAPTLEAGFAQALDYDAFVRLGEPEGHHAAWHERHARLALDSAQQALTAGFARRMKVLCLTGTWCGDCALQGAAMQRVAESRPDLIELRFLQREERHAPLIVPNQINAGFRVPLTWFMAEDYEPLSRIGDRTLSRYRSMARKALGEQGNVLAPPPQDPVREVLAEVLREFERTQLMLRLSPRLRARYGD